MLIFDRIVLVILALGIWTLLLSPREIGALALQEDEVFDGHFCNISGDAYVELPLVRVHPKADFRAKVDTSSLSGLHPPLGREHVQRTSVTEKFAALDDGWVYNTWCVAEGDPERDYSIDVYINGQFIKRFDFEVRDMGLLTKLEND